MPGENQSFYSLLSKKDRKRAVLFQPNFIRYLYQSIISKDFYWRWLLHNQSFLINCNCIQYLFYIIAQNSRYINIKVSINYFFASNVLLWSMNSAHSVRMLEAQNRKRAQESALETLLLRLVYFRPCSYSPMSRELALLMICPVASLMKSTAMFSTSVPLKILYIPPYM